MIFDLDRVQNTEGNGENAGYLHVLLFLLCFQKDFYLGVVKSQNCVVKGLWVEVPFDFFIEVACLCVWLCACIHQSVQICPDQNFFI